MNTVPNTTPGDAADAGEERLPLLPAQEGLWFVEGGRPSAHNVSFALDLGGSLDRSRLSRALRELAGRHAALRCRVVAESGTPVQLVAPSVTPHVTEVGIAAGPAAGAEDQTLDRWITAEQEKPFRLDEGPLFRVTLFRLAERRHVLLFVMHHIVSDGASCDLLARDLGVLYEAGATRLPCPLRA